MNESKKEIYDIIPPQYYPKTLLIKKDTAVNAILDLVKSKKITYPFIAKPDIGLRGSAVQKIDNFDQLKNYNSKADFDYLIQEMILHCNEVGIFYVRYPNEKTGRITGIVGKEFVIVTGNGKATIEDLIRENPRYEMQLESLSKEYGDKLNAVLMPHEKVNLVPYGNHARGAKFLDCSHWNSAALEATINKICLEIPDFYFGRLDLMYDSWAELEKGNNFAIVELNGASSEPTHIYDPKHSIFFAWKELSRHIKYMYQISVANQKNGATYLSHKSGMEEWRAHQQQCEKIYNF